MNLEGRKAGTAEIPEPVRIPLGELTATLYLGNCLELSAVFSGVDAVISDPPFSEKTHQGHDCGSLPGVDGATRNRLGYAAWNDDEVRQICSQLPARGWVAIITDYTLARHWETRLQEVGRYVFAPVPVIVRGRSVRLSGDGPSSWTDWLIVSRTKAEHKWGTLPGVYEGNRGSIEHMGGKPLNAMCRIVEDYSRPGDTVLDFCMGAGTTGVACLRTGRNFIGIEKDPKHFATAVERLEREARQGVLL